MTSSRPGLIKMTRAPFLSSIIAPIIAGTVLSVYINDTFLLINFIFVFIMGITLHVATNVYNDIYDTKQGTDKINVNRNEFSGGSGILQNNMELMPTMYNIARISLLIAFLATVVLTFLIDKSLWVYLWALYLLSAFFSKYYTAAPVKLAYRGWGEISVWFAFGPMAVLVAAVSQNLTFHPLILIAMPLSGISTLSILLIGQMIDLEADKATGKWGIAVRKGRKTTRNIFLLVQLILCADVIWLASSMQNGWPIFAALLPYIIFLPKIWKILKTSYEDEQILKDAAKINVLLHLSFSLLLIVGLLTAIIV